MILYTTFFLIYVRIESLYVLIIVHNLLKLKYENFTIELLVMFLNFSENEPIYRIVNYIILSSAFSDGFLLLYYIS